MDKPTWDSTAAVGVKPGATGAPTWDDTVDLEEKYGDTVGSLKAGGLGAARSLSFGLSDEFLVQSKMMTHEELKAYKEQNPVASGVGEFVGIAGAILAPEVGILGKLAAPVKAVTKLGTAATKAALPAASRIAGAIAPAATNPVINKVLSQAGALAIGSTPEAIAYGLGKNVTEHALGNPDLNAESVIASIGESVLFGVGVGGLFGAGKGAIQAKFPKFLSEVDKAAVEAGDFDTMVKISEIPDTAKQGYIAGKTKLKPNAQEIKDASAEIGVPFLPGQVSADKEVQRATDLLLNGAPTFASQGAKKAATEIFEKSALAVDSTLGVADDITKADLGGTLKAIVSDTVEKQAAPLNALYDTLKSEYQTLPVSEKSLKQIAANIRRIEDVPLSPQAKAIAEGAAKRLESIKTVDDVKRLRSIINQELAPATATPIQKRVTAIIGDKLANLEESAIVRFAEKEMRTSKAKDRILQLLDQRKEANAQYTVFRSKLDQFGKAMGRKRVHGAQDFLDFLDEMTPEKVADRLSSKGNSEFLEFFSKEVPDGMAAISQYQKNLIRQAGLKDGKINIKSALKAVDRMPKEYREKIFTKDELRKLSRVKIIMESFPENFNPSGTSGASAFREFLESPAKAGIGNLRDLGLLAMTEGATASGDKTRAFVQGLSTIEKSAQKTAKAINGGVTAIFSKDFGTPGKIVGFLSASERRELHDKTKPELKDMNASIEKMVEKLDSNTRAVAEFAPQTAAGLQGTMLRASQFLNSKLPGQGVPTKALSKPYQPSDAEIAKWYRYFSSVSKPTEMLQSVAMGTLVPEQIEAVSVVYPKLMNEMKAAVTDKMTDFISKEKSIPYKTKLSLSLFLGFDLVNSLDPMSMVANQNLLATASQVKEAQEMNSRTSKSVSKMDKNNSFLTPMQKSANRQDV